MESVFLYNGSFSWDNKEGFFRNKGVHRFIGRKDYKQPKFVDPDWGVSDEDVFDRALVEFDDFAGRKQRFLGMVLTLSNHAPFNLPRAPGLEPIQVGGEQQTRLNGVHYADWALGRFMDAAAGKAWFSRTLFVFVGDHGFALPPGITPVALLHMHVPLLFYAPGIFPKEVQGVRHRVASQLDIEPTILGLLGGGMIHQSFGRDLFSLPGDDGGYAAVKRSGDVAPVFIHGQEILIHTLGRPSTLHQYNLGFPPSASDDRSVAEPALAQEMEKTLHAFVVVGYNLLKRHLCSPAPASAAR
jgi:phosphoglycerol transferase MdoB-like AlkP superfamily enzyme